MSKARARIAPGETSTGPVWKALGEEPGGIWLEWQRRFPLRDGSPRTCRVVDLGESPLEPVRPEQVRGEELDDFPPALSSRRAPSSRS